MVKNLPVNAGDMGLIPDPGRSHMCGASKLVYHTTELVLQSPEP